MKEENYDFFHGTHEKIENSFKPNTSTTIFQILIWFIIAVVFMVLWNKFYIN